MCATHTNNSGAQSICRGLSPNNKTLLKQMGSGSKRMVCMVFFSESYINDFIVP